jgi:hypothetical protein
MVGLDGSVRVKAHFAVYPSLHAKRPPVEAFLAWVHAEAARDQTRNAPPLAAQPGGTRRLMIVRQPRVRR